jgi:phytoene synthase
MARRDVPFTYAQDLIRGMRTDALGARFETLGRLSVYCHDVASVVGLWLTELFGVHDEWTLGRAGGLGVAMQLTNIARDVGEDWDRGRMYLPQSMLRRHGVTEQVIGELRHGDAPVPEGYAALLEELMTVADAGYAEASEAIGNLPAFFRPSVAVASRVYRGIHDAIRANGYDSIRRRAVASDVTRATLARAALAALGEGRAVQS